MHAQARPLYVAMDETNHGNRLSAQIIVAGFSTLSRDAIELGPNKKDYASSETKQFFLHPSRTYLFAVSSNPLITHRDYGLHIFATHLIQAYFTEHPSKFNRLFLWLDGARIQKVGMKLYV